MSNHSVTHQCLSGPQNSRKCFGRLITTCPCSFVPCRMISSDFARYHCIQCHAQEQRSGNGSMRAAKPWQNCDSKLQYIVSPGQQHTAANRRQHYAHEHFCKPSQRTHWRCLGQLVCASLVGLAIFQPNASHGQLNASGSCYRCFAACCSRSL